MKLTRYEVQLTRYRMQPACPNREKNQLRGANGTLHWHSDNGTHYRPELWESLTKSSTTSEKVQKFIKIHILTM